MGLRPRPKNQAGRRPFTNGKRPCLTPPSRRVSCTCRRRISRTARAKCLQPAPLGSRLGRNTRATRTGTRMRAAHFGGPLAFRAHRPPRNCRCISGRFKPLDNQRSNRASRSTAEWLFPAARQERLLASPKRHSTGFPLRRAGDGVVQGQAENRCRDDGPCRASPATVDRCLQRPRSPPLTERTTVRRG